VRAQLWRRRAPFEQKKGARGEAVEAAMRPCIYIYCCHPATWLGTVSRVLEEESEGQYSHGKALDNVGTCLRRERSGEAEMVCDGLSE
jgi:hypothetical protein